MTQYMELQKNERQKKIMMTVIGLLAGATLVFAFMWFVASRDQSETARSAERHAESCAASFAAYAEGGDEVQYRYAAAHFYAFSEDILLLTLDTSRASYYTDCNRLYALLIERPELCQAHAEELARIMRALQSDVYDLTAYMEIKSLYESLCEKP